MAVRIIYQPYLKGLRPAPPVVCRDEAEGARRAEKALAAGSIIGAHVVRIDADEATGDYGDPEYLLTLGTTPAQE